LLAWRKQCGKAQPGKKITNFLAEGRQVMNVNNYARESPAILKMYDQMIRYLPNIARPGVDDQAIIADTRVEFARLIPEIPYIGAKHLWKNDLILSAMNLAFQRAMQKHGFNAQEVNEVVKDLFRNVIQAQPKVYFSLNRWYFFSPLGRRNLQKWAAVSQLRHYPNSWVFRFVPKNGDGYDFGFDVSECAICKFYHAQGVDELVPALCRLDFVMDEAQHLGLCRCGTLSEGAIRCDFRFRQDAQAECEDA
jgi:hypothetical protein